jgi:hypothetical protein
MDREIAARLRRRPELVAIPKANLRRWIRQRQGQRINPAFSEWEQILRALAPAQLADFLESDSPKASRFWQSSAFCGILTDEERLKILRACEQGRA